MKKSLLTLFLGSLAAALSVSAAMRPTPAYLKKAVVYQVVLRNFTCDGK